MSKVCTGLVTKVSSSPIDKPTKMDEEYGNAFKLRMEVDGEFFLCGNGKSSDMFVRHNGEYVKLGLGDEITFVYEEKAYNDKTYKVVKRSAINLVAKGSGTAVEAAPTKSFAPQTATAGKGVPYEVGIKVGHAINNATILLQKDKPTLADLRAKAIEILQLSEEMKKNFVDIMKGNDSKDNPIDAVGI